MVLNLLKEILTISERCDIDSFGCGCPGWCKDCGKQVYLGKYHDGNDCICGSFCCTLCIFYYVFLIIFCCGYELGDKQECICPMFVLGLMMHRSFLSQQNLFS